MIIKFLGHSCFYIEYNGKKLLIDPFISDNPKVKNFDVSRLAPDYIFLSHGHGDHVSDAVTIAKNNNSKIISNFEVTSWYAKQHGIEVHGMNHGGKWKFDFGTVKYVNAVHSSTMPDGSSGGNPGGFVVWGGERTIYFAGDTALTMDMKLIPLTCPRLDVAVLPIGDNFTMGIDEALLAAQFVDCKNIIACHFDTFGFIEINHEKARQTFASQHINLTIPSIQEDINI